MNLKGQLHLIESTQNVSDSFSKREFVVEVAENPQYPELIKLEFIQEKCSILDGYKVGDKVDVEFNLRGRKWTDKNGTDRYFNTLQAWKINKIEAANEAQSDAVNDSEEDTDDLPF